LKRPPDLIEDASDLRVVIGHPKLLFDHLPYPPPGSYLAAKTVVLRSFLQERRDPYMLMLTPSVKVRGRG
jgi:hypothetical protein